MSSNSLPEEEILKKQSDNEIVSSSEVKDHDSKPDVKIERRQSVMRSYSGPLPSPEDLAAYENTFEGSAERWLIMVEKQSAHRQQMELILCEAEINDQKAERTERRWGQVLGFLIGIITIVTGGVTAVMGANIAGSLIGTGGVIGLVAVFVYGRKQSQVNDNNTKDDTNSKRDLKSNQ